MIYISNLSTTKKVFAVTALAIITVVSTLTIAAVPAHGESRSDLSGIKIVIDPGHGGHDPGAIGPTGLPESKTVLNVAQYLEANLKARGATVKMTRNGDEFIPLDKRASIANDFRADRFISIHLNSAPNGAANRTEVYYSHDNSAAMASTVDKRLANRLGQPEGGAQTADFAVVRQTNMPGILTEGAFISNPKQEARLKGGKYRRQMARAIYEGILSVYKVKKKLIPVTEKPKPEKTKTALKTSRSQTAKKTEAKTQKEKPEKPESESKKDEEPVSLITKIISVLFPYLISS